MNFFPCGSAKPKKKFHKFGLVDVFRSKFKPSVPEEETKVGKKCEQVIMRPRMEAQKEKLNRFVNELAEEKVNYQEIQKLSWNGIPHCIRGKIWKFLLRYALVQGTEETLTKKREEYEQMVKNYWKQKEQLTEENKKIHQTINGDVLRIGPEFNDIFKTPPLQALLKRMLYIWHMRHPASGYVQGMCDIANPFLTVFLSQYLPLDIEKMEFQASIETLSEETLNNIEADCYWCVSKMLEYVVKNYTSGFGGLHEAYSKVQELLCKIDEELYIHLTNQKIDMFSFSFRCISTMMLRMFNPLVGIRLFDTFISYQEEYPTLMIYLVIGILQKFAKQILTKKGDQLMGFIQKLPTKTWDESQLQIVIAEAYVYKKIFSGKP